MKKGVASWLIDNTSLSFEQISDFCGLHSLEISSIADGNLDISVMPQSPITSGQLTKEEITRCEKCPQESLQLVLNDQFQKTNNKRRAAKYTPIARRGDKPNGIAYLLKYHPEITNTQIKKLVGTTNKMIDSIRTKQHWNIKNIKPRDVVLLGLCTQQQFNDVLEEIKDKNDKS
ncbi:DUF1013 domain-containing protein [Flavobacteriaceae bacterium]|nr:DUF1013 domain-containing protein [Flavobacteriaceae bacterium]